MNLAGPEAARTTAADWRRYSRILFTCFRSVFIRLNPWRTFSTISGQRNYQHGRARHLRRICIERCGIHADYLARLRWLHSVLTRQSIDAIGSAQRRFFQPEFVIQLLESVALILHEFDFVSVLDSLEVLPGVGHDQKEKGSFNAIPNCLISRPRRGSSIFTSRELSIGFGKVNLRSARPARFTPASTNCALNCHGCRNHLCHPE